MCESLPAPSGLMRDPSQSGSPFPPLWSCQQHLLLLHLLLLRTGTDAHTLHRYTPPGHPLFFFPICAGAQLSVLLPRASGSAPACSAYVAFVTDLSLASSNLVFRICYSGCLLLEAFLLAPGWTKWPAGPHHSCFCLPLWEHSPHWSVIACLFHWRLHSSVSP